MDDQPDVPEGTMVALAALGDPLRRRLYRLLAAQARAVGRDEAAMGVGISRSAAAFHLDRMVDDGLLETEFRRLSGRQGPGAGRPAKLYRRAARELSISLPARRYELAAGLLAAAVSEAKATGAPVASALDRLARERGAGIAGSVPGHTGRRPSRAALARTAAEALAAEGYEARVDRGEIVLGNCPFSAIVADQPELICEMNLALLEGFSAGLPHAGLIPRLLPTEGACCVRLQLSTP
ncbi:MAG: helix-turn-helix transcriptional regulator [Acidimicrobiales bacterium]